MDERNEFPAHAALVAFVFRASSLLKKPYVSRNSPPSLPGLGWVPPCGVKCALFSRLSAATRRAEARGVSPEERRETWRVVSRERQRGRTEGELIYGFNNLLIAPER